jgi:hypothetical protein
MGHSAAHLCLQRFLGAALTVALTTAAAGDTGKARDAAVFARVLSYELTLEDRAGDAVGVAVIYKQGDAASEANAEEWYKALSDLSTVKIKDRRFFAVKVAYDLNDITSAIDKDGVDVLLASDGLSAEAPAIANLARSKHVLSAGDSIGYVEQSMTLCVAEDAGKPKIYINLNVAQLEGIRFSSNLLKLVTLVR